jgi:hypothetical protein
LGGWYARATVLVPKDVADVLVVGGVIVLVVTRWQ